MTRDVTENPAGSSKAIPHHYIPPKPHDMSIPSVFSVVSPDPPTSTLPFASNLGYSQSNYAQSSYYSPATSPLSSQPYQAPYAPYSNTSYLLSNYQGNYPAYGFPERLFAPSSPLAPLEERLRNTLGTLGNLVRAFGSIVHMLDSTFYAGWSSLMAIVAVAEQLKHLRKEHISKWLGLVNSALYWLSQLIRGQHKHNIETVRSPAEIARSSSHSSHTTLHKKVFTNNVPILGALATPLIAYALYRLLRQLTQISRAHYILARAQHHFQSSDPHCLALSPGDDLYVLPQQPADRTEWTLVQSIRTGRTGYVPQSYISLVESRQ